MHYVPSNYMLNTVLSFEYLLLILFDIVQMLFRHEAFLHFPKVITLLQKTKTFLHSSSTTLIPYPFCCPLNNTGLSGNQQKIFLKNGYKSMSQRDPNSVPSILLQSSFKELQKGIILSSTKQGR